MCHTNCCMLGAYLGPSCRLMWLLLGISICRCPKRYLTEKILGYQLDGSKLKSQNYYFYCVLSKLLRQVHVSSTYFSATEEMAFFNCTAFQGLFVSVLKAVPYIVCI